MKDDMKKGDDNTVIDNLTVCRDHILVSVNPKIYPIDVVYSAAYVLMDKAYFVIEGEPDDEIIVTIRPKEKGHDLEILGRDFNNELINYAVYRMQSDKNRLVRDAIVQRALFTTTGVIQSGEPEKCETKEDSSEDDYLDDPEGIAVPWEDKYGKKDE